MKITIGRYVSESGKTQVPVDFNESIDGLGHSIKVSVWVDYNDSQKQMYEAAEKEALALLTRALQAHSD